jgi:hypothetical protein
MTDHVDRLDDAQDRRITERLDALERKIGNLITRMQNALAIPTDDGSASARQSLRLVAVDGQRISGPDAETTK